MDYNKVKIITKSNYNDLLNMLVLNKLTLEESAIALERMLELTNLTIERNNQSQNRANVRHQTTSNNPSNISKKIDSINTIYNRVPQSALMKLMND